MLRLLTSLLFVSLCFGQQPASHIVSGPKLPTKCSYLSGDVFILSTIPYNSSTNGQYLCGPTGTFSVGPLSSSSSSPTGTAGGDLSGTYPNPTVKNINGTAFSGINGDLVSFGTGNVPSDSSISAVNVITSSTAAGGVLAGTYPNPTLGILNQNLGFVDATYDIGSGGSNRPRNVNIAGTFTGVTANLYIGITGFSSCSSSASPAVCAGNWSGAVVVAAAATTVQVNTTAITANSQILLTFDSSLSTKLSVTCNTTLPTVYSVTARVPATSFTITATAPITNPACFSYLIIN
jgi:hypothetical protein